MPQSTVPGYFPPFPSKLTPSRNFYIEGADTVHKNQYILVGVSYLNLLIPLSDFAQGTVVILL